MKPGSSFGRLLVCLAAFLLVLGGSVGLVAAGSPATGDERALAPSLADGSPSDEDGDPDDATERVGNATDAVDGVEDTADGVGDAANDVDETGAGVDERGDSVGSGAETIDDVTGTIDGLENASDETEETIDGAAEIADSTVIRPPPLAPGVTVTAEGRLADTELAAGVSTSAGADDSDAENSTGPENGSTAEGADRDRSDGDGGVPGPAGTDASAAADAVLVGLLGAMTASAAAGGAGAGAGAGASTGGGTLSAIAGQLRHLRRAGSALPWEMIPVFKYSRYDDSDPLENGHRRAIYETIEAEPGCYLSELGDRSEVSLSTVRHHVRVLEDEGMVTTAKVNGKRRYYLDATGDPAASDRSSNEPVDVELHAALAEPAKRDVLEALADLGPAHNGRLATELGRDPSTISHHLSSLAEDGLVVRERDGRATVNELAPTVEAALEESIDREASSPAPADD
ncbi:winged helix-turn-helix transcriptional regulator [Halosolutus gelatinilyticus]|uniref:winged helix-turn-helix transcriptional regulator n=1 Tax=Halosolutus gelatinilyticus TaxID=2931975 RepID=UPI001FF3A898|nr:helix-turn-helix domain-containing protein [Halosolutus gelatinilyticus]